MASKKLRVGVVGAGDVAQVLHLPTLQMLSHLYTIEAIYDASHKTAQHSATKFNIPHCCTTPEEIISLPQIDVVFILSPDEFHEPVTIAALQAGKHVMLEKPSTIGLTSGQAIVEAERTAPNNARIFVGYMRRYAPSLAAFKREISSIKSIKYARVRDIIGPNAYFIDQSGAYSTKYSDDISAASRQESQDRLSTLVSQAWGRPYESLTPDMVHYSRYLGYLGSHGLSLMRDVLEGLPDQVLASTCVNHWTTSMFQYRDKKSGEPFTCVFEMGIDGVPRFDSHVAVYGQDKTVQINYDTPFVKGLGITVEVDELGEHGEKVHRSIQTSYEDAYTTELKEMYDCLVEGKPIRTTMTDALEDLKLFKMMMDKYAEYMGR